MATSDSNRMLKPTFIDIDETLLRHLLKAETEVWVRKSSINIANGGTTSSATESGERDSPKPNDIASTLVRHGKKLKDIHHFFQKLIPSRYLMKLACHMEPDRFQVAVDEHQHRTFYPGTQAVLVSYKESDKPLHPEEYAIYKCALLAAEYPALVLSHDALSSSMEAVNLPNFDPPMDFKHSQSEDSFSDSRLTPTSKECMLYGMDPISPSSVFPIESDDLTDLVRKAFCLTHKRHTIYKTFIEKSLGKDGAKILLDELRELLLILRSECHPFFQPNIFHYRDDYRHWLEKETLKIEKNIREQEQVVQTSMTCSHTTIPLNFKDKHLSYKRLLGKLYKLESPNSQINIATNEAIPMKPLSSEASRLLNEFGERYMIEDLYRRIALLEYLGRNFDTKEWYCKYVMSVLESLMHSVKSGECFITEKQISMFKTAMVNLHAHIEHSLSRINRVFPKNSPEGALRAVIGLLALLVLVDKEQVFGTRKGKSVGHYLKAYTKDEMRTTYESQKVIIADQLKLRTFGHQATPQVINLMILDISEKLRRYRMYFKEEFIGYFDIVEMAVHVFYGYLMEDVLQLCDTHAVNQRHKNIDYPMIALAYRLSSFDREPGWANYLSLEQQTWRHAFLKHSLSWMNSLHCKLQEFVSEALQQESWHGVTASSVAQTTPQRVPSRPRTITPHTSSLTTPRPAVNNPTRFITPSANSAFVQINSRSGSAMERESTVEKSDLSSDTTPKAEKQSNKPEEITKIDPSGRVSTFLHHKILGSKTIGVSSLRSVDQSSSCDPHSYRTASGSMDSQSSETSSVYADARSHASDLEDRTSCDGDDLTGDGVTGDDVTGDGVTRDDVTRDDVTRGDVTRDDVRDGPVVNGFPDNTSIPVSSSLVDSICGINRVISAVCHISRLLCPRPVTSGHDSLRLSPEERRETKERIEAGRTSMAQKLCGMLESVGILYGYFVIGAESCGISDDELESIIGQRCVSRSLNQLQETGVRPCRHNPAGQERCNTVDSQGECVPPCLAMNRVENSATQSEKVVKEMCVRINNVRTLKNLLATLIETAAQTVLSVCTAAEHEHDGMSVNEEPNIPPKACQNGTFLSSDSMESIGINNVLDKNSITTTIKELQEIEDGLVKLMAYRANAVIKKLLQLLLTLNLRSFNSRKRMQPVLNATKRTIHTLAFNLYHDCYVAVLHNFWLAIVKDFDDERKKLVFLNGTAAQQADMLLEAISYFIGIFRAEEDGISLSFVSSSIEPVLKSLHFYTQPTSSLVEMYRALQMRNESAVSMADNRNIRHRYQRPPSDVLITRLRIELHSEYAHFSGRRFVECVADHIRYEGNLKLGICAVPNGGDEESAVTLGQYLLENGVIHFFGKVATKPSEDSDEDNLMNDLTPKAFVNDIAIFKSSSDVFSLPSSSPSSSLIIREDGGQSACFSKSEKILYEFESSDLEESFHAVNHEYQVIPSDNTTQDDITRVLFTRRNIEREASNFLDELEPNDVLENLRNILATYAISNCCLSRAPPS